MSVNKTAPAKVDPIAPSEAVLREDTRDSYTSDTYQKVLDYHVAEILLSTIVLAVIALLRLHH
jgi:hypothetical protein